MSATKTLYNSINFNIFPKKLGVNLKIVKINTDENSAIAIKYGVTSIPMLNVYVNGEVVKTIIGAKPKPALLKELESFIS